MKPVDQTTFGLAKGNCFQAVIASLLELPLDEVPHFCEDAVGPDWWKPFSLWCRSRGFSPVELEIDASTWRPEEGQICWLSGASPRNKDWSHGVVGVFKDGEYQITHDPHPSRDGLAGGPQQVGFLIALDPLLCKPQVHEQQPVPDGTPWVRDPEHPCELYYPGEPEEGSTCLGDGHGLCLECTRYCKEEEE